MKDEQKEIVVWGTREKEKERIKTNTKFTAQFMLNICTEREIRRELPVKNIDSLPELMASNA